jgi:hypothetical protein
VRHADWTDPLTYYRLPLLPGLVAGDWVELYDDRQQLATGVRPGSVRLLLSVSGWTSGYVPYWGPVSPYERDPANFARTYLDF